MIRKTLTAVVATLVLSAAIAPAVDAATTRRTATSKPSKARAAAPRDAGSAAVDALNEKSLAAARGQ